MMSSDPRSKTIRGRANLDFGEVDPKETSKAWNRFLAQRHAPTLPMTGVRSVIYQSWLRSNTTGVKPDQFAAPSLETNAPQSKSTYDHAELRRATSATLSQIGELLSGAEAMLILTDRDGVILKTVGDNSTLEKASKINLSVSGVWSEHLAGTNGIGTALWTGHPVYVHGEEHFCEGMKAWSCAAAPLRDPIDRSIIGVINLSGLTTIFRKHNAAFAATAARDIEISLEQEQSHLNMRLMQAIIGKFPARAQEPTEGLAILDRFGRLIFNRNTGLDVGKTDKDLGLGARFLDMPDGITEEKILASLPADHRCEDIRLIDIDGAVKGAALVFKPAGPARATARRTGTPDLPGVTIAGTDLKIVGQSDAILDVLDTASRVASSAVPTLIEGQTGVGKELIARLIHSLMTPGRHQAFSTINCGGTTQDSFRDALLQETDISASGGGFAGLCVFDEMGEMPPDVQPLMLRLLEQHMTRLPGPDETTTGATILSMTNRVMMEEVELGRFRRDLYYRLSTISIKVPPLRERGDDILLIAEHYNRKLNDENGRGLLILSADIQDKLMAHSWPGNVRELKNVIASLHFLAKSRNVALSDLPRHLTVATRMNDTERSAASAQAQRLSGLVSLKQAEVLLIENSLTAHGGNLSKAAMTLGISRPTLYRKMRTHGMALAGTRSEPT